MDTCRIHRAISADGTEIAGRVHGHGPPLVLVPGGPADGETAWPALLPHLSEHFTCYAINTRGRGLSGDHPDHSRERLVADVVAFVESIGDEVLLFGHSAGGTHALEAAAHTSAVGALALYEPTLTELADEKVPARFSDAFARVRRAVDEGRPADGAWIFLEELAMANDTERAILSEVDAVREMAPLVPVVLEEQEQSGLPRLTDLALLERVTMPVLLLHGSRTNPFYTGVVTDLAGRIADCRVREIAGVGHLGPEIEPEPVAAELVRLREASGLRHG
ncbi:alpha/beta hydrolase [Haloechinothrix sp. YIM 98757]|uniref:Alpha/beta hydrolase n=1 Tax=Haloechinothrix aidingensis TaxID=2752311 RepID=A0A838AAY0_9PSEU|nr:alpha/beta hydrolase [Haloechinothrix aidingensis]MBA0126378.1 alpha/beta hydrolase [Haloechinothrix aidingensis]